MAGLVRSIDSLKAVGDARDTKTSILKAYDTYNNIVDRIKQINKKTVEDKKVTQKDSILQNFDAKKLDRDAEPIVYRNRHEDEAR